MLNKPKISKVKRNPIIAPKTPLTANPKILTKTAEATTTKTFVSSSTTK